MASQIKPRENGLFTRLNALGYPRQPYPPKQLY